MYGFAEALRWKVDAETPSSVASENSNAIANGSNENKTSGAASDSSVVNVVMPKSEEICHVGAASKSPYKVGDLYRFGNYDWRVLDVKNNKALLLILSCV